MISVVVPTYARPENLAKCLQRLQPGQQSLPSEHYEVIVSDDSRDELSLRLVEDRFPWARAVKGPARGPASNRNNGARHARGQWLAFTDDDCVPAAEWLEAFHTAIGATGSRVLEGRTLPEGPKSHLAWEAPVNLDGGRLWSCNLLIERRLFQELGGFDERYPDAAMEDIDLRTRLQQRGERWEFVPAAEVVHPWRPRGSFARQMRTVHALRVYFQRHPDVLRQFRWTYIGTPLLRAWVDVVEGRREHGFRGIFSYLVYAAASVVQSTAILWWKLRSGAGRPDPAGPLP